MDRIETCANCENFKRYYILNVSLRFIPTDKGFCIVRKRKDGSKRQVAQSEGCELWQSDQAQKLHNRYVVENVLQDIGKKLEAIRALLSEDNQQGSSADEL